jgi:penicillin-binding protein 2
MIVVPALMNKITDDKYENYRQIAEILGIETTQVRELVEVDGIYNWNELAIAKNLPREKALLFKTKNIPGFFIEDISSRKYYCDYECAHVIGYTGQVSEDELAKNDQYQPIDQVGRSGLESFYEDELKGINGADYRIVDASGRTISVLTPRESLPGKNLVTSIDEDLQKLAYEELKAKIGQGNTTGGSVIISDPNTGEILTLASAPSFSAEKMSQGISQDDYNNLLNDKNLPLFNRPIAGEYPPGSTFKIVTASAILSENIAGLDDYVFDGGSVRIVNKFDPNIVYVFWGWNHSGLGNVNIVDALALSSDIYFYIYGGGFEDKEGLGIDRLKKYAEKYMLSKTLGIDIDGERTGFIPTPDWKVNTFGEEWYLGDDYNTAIGQGDILATPLQVNSYTSAIANGGKIYRPHLIKKLIDEDKKTLMEIKPELLKDNIISPENIDIIRTGLEAVTDNGTAKILQNAIVKVAGKTGTAQFENNTKEHAWYTCYAPIDNPQIAVTVMVEGGGEGSEVAAPIALKLINKYFDKPDQT